MNNETIVSKDEKIMAGLAHGGILLGLFTNGIGGIGTALLVWLTQKEKSAYVANQALQALVYQVSILVVATVMWSCWGVLWLLLIVPSLIVNPGAYQAAPPPGLWVGLGLMVIPLGLWGLSTLYGLWGAFKSLNGQPFKYAIVGKWLEKRN